MSTLNFIFLKFNFFYFVVLAIGGVREKVMAAKRTKITRLILPDTNKDDFEQLPESVKKGITAHFADNYEDVFKVAFPKQEV